jgi:hypothetical protein
MGYSFVKHQTNSLSKLNELARGRESKTPGIVMGTAPNIKWLKGKVFSGIRIGVGDAPWRAPELGPFDYWVCSNSEYPIPWIDKHRESLEQSDAVVLLAPFTFENYPDKLPELFEFVEKYCFSDKYLWYDQSHFGGNFCSPPRPCCEFYNKYISEPSIQELLNKTVGNSSLPLIDRGSTVALFGYALAILLRLDPIYLIGIELPEQLKDYKHYKNWKRPAEKTRSKLKRLTQQYIRLLPSRPIDLAGKREEIVRDFSTLNSYAMKLGIRTISLSPTSPLNRISGIHYKDGFI